MSKPTTDPLGPREPRLLRSVDLRHELASFAEAMEEKLVANDHKKHWRTVDISYLRGRLEQELDELAEAETPEAIRAEAIDVANFAMMIYDWLEYHRE